MRHLSWLGQGHRPSPKRARPRPPLLLGMTAGPGQVVTAGNRRRPRVRERRRPCPTTASFTGEARRRAATLRAAAAPARPPEVRRPPRPRAPRRRRDRRLGARGRDDQPSGSRNCRGLARAGSPVDRGSLLDMGCTTAAGRIRRGELFECLEACASFRSVRGRRAPRARGDH
jgi:hypothetical protein